MGTSISGIIQVTTLGTGPGPATGLATSAIATTSMTLTWAAPSSGDLPFSYQPQVAINAVPPVFTNIGGPISGTTVNAASLLPGTMYLFRVVTSNSAGASTSATVSATTAFALPGAPTGLAQVSVSSTTVAVSWVAPVAGTAPLNYLLEHSPHSAGIWSSANTTISGVTGQASGLTPSTSYDFRVSASNQAGSGPVSATFTVSTTAASTAVTWQPTGASAAMTFSSDHLTATAGGSAVPYASPQSCVSTTSLAAGKASFEITLNNLTQNTSVGLVNSSFVAGPAGGGGSSVNSVAFYPGTGQGSQAALTEYFNNSVLLAPATAAAPDIAGATITACVNRTSGLWWLTSPAMRAAFGVNGGPAWNDSPTADPNTGVGGIPIGVVGPLFLCADSSESGAVFVLNAGLSAYTYAVPAAFPAWNGGAPIFAAPGQVTGLAAGTAQATAVPLTWAKVTGGTAPFTYTMQWSLTGANVWTTAGTSQTTAGIITGLASSTVFDFRVFATNSGGQIGAPSSIVSAGTASSAGLPGQVQSVGLSNPTNTTLSVTWQPPITGSPLTGYQVQYKASSSATWLNALPPTASADGTVIVPGGGPIIDTAGNVWQITPGGVFEVNGILDTTTSNVIEGVWSNQRVWQENSGLLWWSKLLPTDTWAPSGGTSTGPFFTPATPPPPPPPPPGSQFKVSGGKIFTPAGAVFVARGVDTYDSQLPNVCSPGSSSLGPLLSQFPHMNMLRVACNEGTVFTSSYFAPFVTFLTGLGIVVELGYYKGSVTGSVATGQALADEVAWFTEIATAFKTNPYVWFSTCNEPGDGPTFGGATTAEQLTAYNAIRATGNTSMIGIEDTFATLKPANYTGMNNIHWDFHCYNWESGYSTDVTANYNSFVNRANLLSGLFNSADGVIPKIVGEFGDSTTGEGRDPGGLASVQAVLLMAQNGVTSGYTAWGLYPGGSGDNLNSGNTLTDYGRMVAADILAH